MATIFERQLEQAFYGTVTQPERKQPVHGDREMKAYVVYCHNDSADPKIRVFRDRTVAVTWAKDFMRMMVDTEDDLFVQDKNDANGYYEIYISYEAAGDYAFVKEVRIQ